VVAPPHCLQGMLDLLDVGAQLPVVMTAQHAVSRARRQAGG